MDETIKIQFLGEEGKNKIREALKKFFEAFHRYDAYLERCRHKEDAKEIKRQRSFFSETDFDKTKTERLLELYNQYFHFEGQQHFHAEGSQAEEMQQQALWKAFSNESQHKQKLDDLSLETLKTECEAFEAFLEGRRREARGEAVGAFVGSFFLGLGMAAFAAGIIAVLVCVVVFVFCLDPFIAGLVAGVEAFLLWAGNAFEAGGRAVDRSSHLSTIKEAVKGLSKTLAEIEGNVDNFRLPVPIRPREMSAQRNAYLYKLGIQGSARESQPQSTRDAAEQPVVRMSHSVSA